MAPPPSELEQIFAQSWRLMAPCAAAPIREHVFAAPRKWRFDFAWLPHYVAVEIQGGMFKARSGHRSYQGVRRDHAKLNAAQALGWVVLQFDGEQVRKSTPDVIDQVLRVLAERGAAVG